MPDDRTWPAKESAAPLARPDAFPKPSSGTLSRINATKNDLDKTELLQEYFLQSLAFPQMTDRENEVNKATIDTYSWLLKDDSEFVSWLVDKNEQIYWINGKPGCGKSTLMRFMSENPITTRKLKMWSGSRPFIMASYYFWTSGTKDQRSQTGLLRSLLYQLLVLRWNLIPLAIPDLWLKVWTMSTQERIRNPITWEFGNLFTALRMLLGQILLTMNVVLFVDGLDEFDGDHAEIIAVFNGLVNDANKSMKLCLSSRSWPVFEQGYQGRPQFKLQDFTYQDINLHIFQNLKAESILARLSTEAPEWYAALVEGLVQKAEGVFLWASLAVKYICKVSYWLQRDFRKTNADGWEPIHSSEEIKTVAESLPGELDEFFGWLVFNHPQSNPGAVGLPATILKAREIVTEFTGDQTTAIITLWDLIIASVQPSIDEQHQGQADSGPIWIDDTESSVEQVDNDELKIWLRYYKNVLDNAAPGLLVHHIKRSSDERRGPRMIGEEEDDDLTPEQREARGKVTYAHRTVKDWLDRTDIQKKLATVVYKNAQPQKPGSYTKDHLPHMINLGICQLSRRTPVLQPRKGRSINDVWPFIILTMTHARLAQDELDNLLTTDPSTHHIFQDRYIQRLTAIDAVLTWYWRKSPGNPDDTWSKNSFGSYESRKNMIFNNPWLSICTRFGLRIYVLDSLSQLGPWQSKGEVPFLAYAVEFLVSRKNTVYPLSEPLFVAALLQKGFRTDEQYLDGKRRLTPWTYLLENLQQAERRGWIVTDEAGRWVEICNLFLKYGASLQSRTEGWAKDPSIGALELLSALKEKYCLDDSMNDAVMQ